MRTWRTVLIKWMGLANILVALLGVCLTVFAVVHLVRGFMTLKSILYYPMILFAMAILNAVWFYLCATSGVRLWKRDTHGYIVTRRLFGFEVVYFLLVIGLAPASAIFALSALSQWFPLYYSVLGLILLTIVVRKRDLPADSVTWESSHSLASKNSMSTVATRLVKTIAGLNILFGILGFVILVLDGLHATIGILHGPNTIGGNLPQLTAGAIDFLIMLLLILSGRWLLSWDRRGFFVANFVFVFELSYWIVLYFLPPFLYRQTSTVVLRSSQFLDAIHSLATVPQLFMLYPFFAFLLLNTMGRHSEWRVVQTRGLTE